MATTTTTATAKKAYASALDQIDRLETALYAARRLRANAIRAMREAGMTWPQIEKETGLTRQRLNKLTHDFPAG